MLSMRKIAIFFFFKLVLSASAIVVQDYTAATNAPPGLASGVQGWDDVYVYNYQGSSAVAIDPYWMLTAGHVADDGPPVTMNIAGAVYNQVGQPVYYNNGDADPNNDGVDLALVRFDKPLPGYYPLYTDATLVGLPVIIVGYGNTGTVSSNYWIKGGTGRGTPRWGSQVIDRTRIFKYSAGGEVGYVDDHRGFFMDFHLSNTTHEAGTAVGDSGGGVFYNDAGVWKLAGINTATDASGSHPDSTFAIRMDFYAGWIAETVPEPAVIGLMGLSTIGLCITRSLSRHDKRIRKGFHPKTQSYGCDLYEVTKGSVPTRKGSCEIYSERWYTDE